MSLNEAEPFIPQKLPLKRLKRSSFHRTLLKATKTLQRFNALLQSIPQPQTLLSSLFATEALSALESQKILISLEDFFVLCLTHSHRDKTLLQLVHYYAAIKRACRDIYTQPISKQMLCAIHQMVKKGAPKHIQAGDYRTKQNWIGPEGCKKEQATFFPPAPKVMRTFMTNLLKYCEKQEKDPLTQIAISIAQLLIIHPFRDGNGRTARILIPLLFYQKKVLPHPLLFFSRYLKDERTKYFQNLFDITGEGKWEQWIAFFLQGIVQQVKKEHEQTEQIYRLYLKLKQKHSLPTNLLAFLFSQPVFSRSFFMRRYSRQLLKDLESQKIIQPFKKGYYTFPALLRILKNKNLGK